MEQHQAGSPSVQSTALPTPVRPGTPNTDGTPQDDRVESRASRSAGPVNPFTSPSVSRPNSSYDSTDALGQAPGPRYFHSRRVKKGEVEKPWLEKKDPKEKWVTIIPILGILVGLGISGFLVWDGIRSVIKHDYCLVLEDNFATFNADVWTKEVQVGGFGNGEFVQTTGNDENVFVQDGRLIIRPTLQDANLIENDALINLLEDGTCTSTQPSDCIAATNTTVGNATIVPPTKSGRIHTKKGASIKYGRVEVTAKLPEGDWIWPAIWMMPVRDTYGAWPASGEIDIMESRGNNWTYGQGGNNIVSSALHWGPDPANDAWWRTNVKREALHTTYSAGFNTFGLEWSQKYLFTYVNSRLLQVLYTNFDEPLWKRGNFPEASSNGTRLADTWTGTGRLSTPFDQEFYLIINVAIGGTNGWFEDSKSGKPWINGSPNAKKDFWNARDSWLPTWTSPAMEVSKVIMWQQCDGDEEL
ncbi:glycoside hydrolase family 16 protein [Durotheca rogersii]|uniref:glycoside hydrolase family 16 protein n=1 Tax=Durotheca rogersii TaxID=419775 RepID=UPI00221FA3B7|nr:glycoside hydrolase family 16 protein [Durotheca rogersii]KAI5867382.1 glycoside hydrolase family 16 protein [Durotheca rogersii]